VRQRTLLVGLTLLALLCSMVVLVPPAEAAVGLRVSGGRVVEANGAAFVMRGVSHAHVWYPDRTSSFADIKSLGANTVRVVLGSGQRWGPTTAAEVSTIVSLCRQSRLICVLEVHDTTGYGEEGAAATLDQAATYWIGVRSALVGQENHVVINLGNEPFGNNQQVSATWAAATTGAIGRLRAAGLDHLIMVDAPMWGQDWQGIQRDNAASVLAGDPNRNTVFSIHMYGVYDTAAEIEAYLNAFRTAGLALVIGEFGHNHSDGNPDEDTIMAQAQSRGLGYLGWSWSGNSGGVEYLDMVTGFNPAALTSWGVRIFNGANGIRQTSREATIYGGGPGDTTPPSTPGAPVASAVTSGSVTLNWAASTDNVGVVGYDVHRATGSGAFAVVGTPATNSFTDAGLAADTTYRYFVRARDAVPNHSPNSATVTVTTLPGGPPPTGNCRVAYTASNWGGSNGFTAGVMITNTGITPITGWTLAFAYAAGQRLTPPGWSATWTQTGPTVTATPLDWNRTINPGATITIGFNGTYTGTNPAPAGYTLNGNACATG